MNDNPDIVEVPPVAEAKAPHRPSHQVLAIKREIMTYAGGQAHFIEKIEEQAQIITEQQERLDTLTEKYRRLGKEHAIVNSRLCDYRQLTPDYNLSVLHDTIDKQMVRYEELNIRYNRALQKLNAYANFEYEDRIMQLNEQLDEERDRVYKLRKILAKKEKIIKILKYYNEK